MKEKDFEPLQFEFYQSKMEEILIFLDEVMKQNIDIKIVKKAEQIKYDIECKIEYHQEEGEWI